MTTLGRRLALLWPLGCLAAVAWVAVPAVAQRRIERADIARARAADVALAQSRQIPARIVVTHDDVSLTPDESYQWVVISDGFGPRGSAA